MEKLYDFYEWQYQFNQYGEYDLALEMAGATILAFGRFGDYQGTWIAKVQLLDGTEAWVSGSYGSCSGCDAFEANFRDYLSGNEKTDDQWRKELAEFGQGYLNNNTRTWDELMAEAQASADWDLDADEIIEFLNTHK